MRHLMRLPTYDVRFEMFGRGDGTNFSLSHAADEAHANIAHLRQLYGATSSARIVPKLSYDAQIAPASGHMEVPSAALVSTTYLNTLILLPADCIPLVLASSSKPVCALIHAGRRELDSGIIERTLQAMTQQCGVAPRSLTAYLGPGIKQSSYRLPHQVLDTLEHDGWKPYVKTESETILLDCFGFARQELETHGVPKANISESKIDTATDARYYSHYAHTRLGQAKGANGCIAVMKRRIA